MIELIQQLVDAWGPSGYEHHVRRLIQEQVADFADEMTVDPLGNLIVRVGSGGTRVMIAAHMDEIGVMATYIEPTSGYLRFENIGGLIGTSLLGSRVRFEDGTLGVIGVHDQWGAHRNKAPNLNEFFVDVSDGNGRDASEYVGRPAVLDGPFAARGNRLVGRAMDDRIGCAVAIEALKRLNKETANEVYVVFTVQEELGVRGARPAAHGIAPDVALAVDVAPTGDEPRGLKVGIRLGAGTAIKIKDSGLVVPASVRDWMIQTAEDNNIPYQLELLPMGQTDAAAIQTALAGVPSGAISIPCRFVHTQGETVDMADVGASVDLLVQLLSDPVAK